MDKYKAAIIEYEAARQSIIDCGKAIGAAGQTPIEWIDGETCVGGKPLCSNRNGGFLDGDHCIERYWQANKEARTILECEGVDVKPEKVDLCPSCTEVDRLFMVRKKERQRFGVAKRRITQLGKGAKS